MHAPQPCISCYTLSFEDKSLSNPFNPYRSRYRPNVRYINFKLLSFTVLVDGVIERSQWLQGGDVILDKNRLPCLFKPSGIIVSKWCKNVSYERGKKVLHWTLTLRSSRQYSRGGYYVGRVMIGWIELILLKRYNEQEDRFCVKRRRQLRSSHGFLQQKADARLQKRQPNYQASLRRKKYLDSKA